MKAPCNHHNCLVRKVPITMGILIAILFAACLPSKKSKREEASHEQKEDLEAKRLLQGIWIDEDSEEPLMSVRGDTIRYANERSTPVRFRIVDDSLYTYGSDTMSYKIDKQTEQEFWFHPIADNLIRLRRSDSATDSLFFDESMTEIPIYNEVVKRDSVVYHGHTRYHVYAYINPSTMKVVKRTYTEEGIQVDNVYYDNVMHICVYEGKKSLFASDIKKNLFTSLLPADFLSQAILSDIRFVKVDKRGFLYRATLSIPESSVCATIDLIVGFDGTLHMNSAE